MLCIDKIIDAEVPVGVQQEDLFEDGEHCPDDPEAVGLCDDEIVDVVGFVHVAFRDRAREEHPLHEREPRNEPCVMPGRLHPRCRPVVSADASCHQFVVPANHEIALVFMHQSLPGQV